MVNVEILLVVPAVVWSKYKVPNAALFVNVRLEEGLPVILLPALIEDTVPPRVKVFPVPIPYLPDEKVIVFATVIFADEATPDIPEPLLMERL